MSSFHGLIEEIPCVSVDRFNGDNLHSSVYFLSHCHTDHMEGLDVQFFRRLHDEHQYLYCTPISKIILTNIHRLHDNFADTIRTIDGCAPIVISYNDGNETLYLTVTCISAGHCPGSVMFLFENNHYCILYTGDFRIDVDDLSKLKPLHNNESGKIVPKKFHTVYLDTTFFHSDFKYFPSRQRALSEICKFVHSWISQSDKNMVILECSGNYGPEHLFIELSHALNIRIHVKNSVFNSYTFIPELANCITNDSYASQVHACMGKISHSGLQCRSDVESKFIITVIPSCLRWKKKDMSKNISEWDHDRKRFYVCYSCHSSHDEIGKFIKYFSPKKLYPCVCPKHISAEDLMNELNELLYTANTNVSNDCSFNLARYKSLGAVESKTLNFSDDDDDD